MRKIKPILTILFLLISFPCFACGEGNNHPEDETINGMYQMQITTERDLEDNQIVYLRKMHPASCDTTIVKKAE